MIDLNSESSLSLSQAARLLPPGAAADRSLCPVCSGGFFTACARQTATSFASTRYASAAVGSRAEKQSSGSPRP